MWGEYFSTADTAHTEGQRTKHKTEEWKCYFNLIFTFITTTSQVAENRKKQNKKQTDLNSHTHSSLVMISGLHG